MRVELYIPLTLNEIARACGARGTPSDEYVTAVCTDTREARSKDLFIALDGEGDSGEEYVAQALHKGCYTLSRRRIGTLSVNDTAQAMLDLGEYYKSRIDPLYTVAVTGSVGKSTTVKFITKILGAKYKVHSPIGNFNNHVGVPLTLLAAPRDTEVIVTELGMNHKNEISRLSGCVRPDVGVITSVGTAHIGNLGSREQIAKAKLEILDGMTGGTLLLPENEPLLSSVDNAMRVGLGSSLSEFSLYAKEYGNLIFSSPHSVIGELVFFDRREHLLSDLAFALSVATILGLSESEIIKGVSTINESDLRQRFIPMNGYTIFDDSYNASLESITADLKFMRTMKRPIGAFFADVLELGDASVEIHERIGRTAAEHGLDSLYLLGEHAEDVRRGAVLAGMDPERIFINADPDSPLTSVKHITENHVPGELILFKASHRLRLDKIADLIKNTEGD